MLVILLAMIVLAIAFGIVGFDDLVGLDILAGIVAIFGVTLGFVVVCAYIADAIVGAAVAGLLLRGPTPMPRTREIGVMALGAAVVVVLSAIPVIGPWVKFVVILLGLGGSTARVVERQAAVATSTGQLPGGDPAATGTDGSHGHVGRATEARYHPAASARSSVDQSD